MAEENTLVAEPTQVIPNDRSWFEGISSNQSVQTMPEQEQSAIKRRLEAEIRYRRVFEAARDGILILNADTGRIDDANPFMSELLGYPKEYLVGKELWEIGLFQDIAIEQSRFC